MITNNADVTIAPAETEGILAKPLHQLWRDPQFIAVLLAGPAFWALLWIYLTPRFEGLWPLRSPTAFLLPALVYPVLEELVFRGLLQRALWSRSWGRKATLGISLANVETSLVFTLLHFIYHPLLWAASVFAPSLVFGYFRDRYQRVLPAVVLHVFYNAGFFWLIAPAA